MPSTCLQMVFFLLILMNINLYFLFPFISQVAVGRRPELQVFGNDWPTADGSGVRD